ncbi:MAG: type IX secretion system protein PorQ, partial [Bacteroidales bacterium]|nr:type IX secretion system protein PorQ [Bacteroidales bacterium]
MKKIPVICLLLLIAASAAAQRGGESVYSFLQLTNAARVSALGGENVSLSDDDINLVFHNPALLNSRMDQHMNLNYVNYFAGVNYGYASYAFERPGIGTFAGGIHYVDYGSFERTDEYGISDGTFRASEYALNLVYARPLIDSVLTVGVNVKPLFSIYEQYTSLGLVADVGLLYTNFSSNTSVGLAIKNFGVQIVSFSGTRERVPFEIQAGLTQGLAHAPFRFNIQLQHLERWDLTYDKVDDSNPIFGGEQEVTNRFDLLADQLMRHVVVGVELLLGENFHFDLGYNYKRRQEMKMDNLPGMVGFSWGFGFRMSKFHMAYGRSAYHLAGGTNHFSLTTDL